MSLLGRCKCVLLLCALSACAAAAEEKHHKDPPSAAEKKQAVSALLRAREILLAMRKNGEAKELLKQIPRLLATAGSAASARETVTMLATSDREGALSEVVRAQLQNDDVAGALETAAGIPSEAWRSNALAEIAEAQAKTKDFEGALRTAALISTSRIEAAVALTDIARQEAANGNNSDAGALLLKAKSVASLLAANSEDGSAACGIVVLPQIASAQTETGEKSESAKTMQLFRTRYDSAGNECRAQALYARFRPNRNGEKVSEAVESQLDELRSNFNYGRYAEVVDSEEVDATDGDGEETVVEGAASNAPTLAGQKRDETPSAKETLDALRSMTPLDRRAVSAAPVAFGLAQRGNFVEAQEAVDIGIEEADALKNAALHMQLLAGSAQVSAMAGKFDAAKSALDNLPESALRSAALAAVARRAAGNGSANQALAWAAAETSPLSEATTLISIAEGLLQIPENEGRYIR